MKTLSTAAAAIALGVSRKTLDNALAREARSLVSAGRRGRSRRVSITALEQIAVAFVLNRDLGVGVARGLELAKVFLERVSQPVPVGSLCAVTFDVARLRHALALAVDEVLESVAEPERGRPRSRTQPEN